MQCPHCHTVTDCVWIGFGKDWVLCHECQQPIRWAEVETQYLLREDEEGEGVLTSVSYH